MCHIAMALRDPRSGKPFVWDGGVKRFFCNVAGCDEYVFRGGKCANHNGARKKCTEQSCSNIATGKSSKCEGHAKYPVADDDNKCELHDHDEGHRDTHDHTVEPKLPAKPCYGSKSWAKDTSPTLQPVEKHKLKQRPDSSCSAEDCRDKNCTTHASRLCIVKGCKSVKKKKNMCQRHAGMDDPICTIDGCDNGVLRSGVCSDHVTKPTVKICSEAGCKTRARKKGKCTKHAGVKYKKCSSRPQAERT